MKSNSWFYLLTLGLLACGRVEPEPFSLNAVGEGLLTVYKDCGFTGPRAIFEGEGVFGIEAGASSIRVRPGYKVTFFSGENLTGDSLTKNSDDDCLVNEGWNDRALSLRLEKDGGNSALPSPPASWQEHWFEHNQSLGLVFYDNDVAIYYDTNMDRGSTTWLNQMVGDAWRYTKRVYGSFGRDERLFAVFHQNRYGGGHPSTYFDASHDYRNMIDLATNQPWRETSGWTVEATIHEIGHIVEGASKGVHGSPGFGLWGDSKWCEIFVYDVLKNIGWKSEADRVLRQFSNARSDFPRAGSYWFRDWYLPVYNSYGGSVVLNRYFELLAQKLPRRGTDYAHTLNWGEYIHFMSGAAGKDLKSLATRAFGWTPEWENQWGLARQRFPLAY